MSYDRRERGTDVEVSADAALQTARQLIRALAMLESCDEDAPIMLTSALAPGGESIALRSTLGRELLFVISHTIHHQALIGLLLSTMGRPVPDRFGVAPSTPSLVQV